jgi:hypothetical protein
MAFLIYKRSPNAETIRYERLQPLKLGGRDGLIAQYVKTLTAEQIPSWKLSAPALLTLAGFPAARDEFSVLFDVTDRDATNVCLYELTRIHGSSRDTSTQLALDFTVVVDKEMGDEAVAYAQKFEIPLAEKPRQLGETLALTGGPAGGNWKWAGTSLQIGATVVQAQHGHTSGEPCPNCSCGRREALNK